MRPRKRDAGDSQGRPLPAYLEPVAGGVEVRLRRLPPEKVALALPAAVLLVPVASIGGARMLGVVVATTLVVALLPVAVLWQRYRGAAIPVPALRVAAAVELGVAILLAGVGVAAAVVVTVSNLSPGAAPGVAWYRLASVVTVGPVMGCGYTAGWLLRVARRVDPVTPSACLPPARPPRPVGFTVDYGEGGARFPNILVLALGAPVAAAAWLGMVSGLSLIHGFGGAGDLVAMGAALGLVPLIAGVAWWPWLRPALSRGLRPGQVRAVGFATLSGVLSGGLVVGGVLLTYAVPSGPGDTLLVVLGVAGVGAVLAVPGWQLIAFGTALRRADLAAGERMGP